MTGTTLIMFGWVIGSATMMGLGLLGNLFAFGAGMFRYVFRLNEITESASKQLQTTKLLEQKQKLDQLDRKLVKTKDKRDEVYLRDLRAVYDGFVEDALAGKVSMFLNSSIIGEVDAVFSNTVGLLDYSYDIWKTAQSMKGSTKETVLQQREQILNQVEGNVQTFSETVNRIRALRLNDGVDYRSDIQHQLSIQLRAAERTQEQMKRLRDDDLNRFDEFQLPES